MTRLKDGQSVRVDFDVDALRNAGGESVAHAGTSFSVSYDLWEERFAVTRIGSPSRSTSHLTRARAEAWCLEQLMLPLGDVLRGAGRDAPFWIRLAYRVIDRPSVAAEDASGRLSLKGLIDVLSRRRTAEEPTGKVEGGPFRLPR